MGNFWNYSFLWSLWRNNGAIFFSRGLSSEIFFRDKGINEVMTSEAFCYRLRLSLSFLIVQAFLSTSRCINFRVIDGLDHSTGIIDTWPLTNVGSIIHTFCIADFFRPRGMKEIWFPSKTVKDGSLESVKR